MEQETTQKRRGRPQKVAEDNPVAETETKSQETSATVATLGVALEELRAMQEQNRYQMAMFMKMADKMGLNDLPKPPSEDTVVLEPTQSGNEEVVDEFARPTDNKQMFPSMPLTRWLIRRWC